MSIKVTSAPSATQKLLQTNNSPFCECIRINQMTSQPTARPGARKYFCVTACFFNQLFCMVFLGANGSQW